MSAPTDGGPAFPVLRRDAWDRVSSFDPGMTLRDYFAGQALVGLLGTGNPADLGQLREAWTSEAYILADAMLTARARKEER